MDRTKYPANWKAFSLHIRKDRAQGRCECAGECGEDPGGRCEARAGGYRIISLIGDFETLADDDNALATFFGTFDETDFGVSAIVLTVAHLHKHGCSYTPPYCTNEQHVKAMCQACHLRYDSDQHKQTAARTRRRKKNNLDLFELT